MPNTKSYPFKRLAIDHMVKGITRVWWDFVPNFKDPLPYRMQLQFGRTQNSNATDWVNVGTVALNPIYLTDDTTRLFGNTLDLYYRIVLTTPNGTYVSEPAGVYGWLTTKDWCLAREIIRKEQLRHRLVSRSGFLLKRMRYGTTCTECRDPLTDSVTSSFCPACNGVGYKVGYHEPLPYTCFDVALLTKTEKKGADLSPPAEWSSRENIVNARVIGLPDLRSYDVWIDEASDRRYVITDIKESAVIRGVPIIYDVGLELLPFNDMAYNIAIDCTSTADIENGPTSGCGTIEVTQHYGGTDELAYTTEDGCYIIGATIKVYLKHNYDNGFTSDEYIVAQTTTTASGNWTYALYLDPQTYVFVYEKPGDFGPDILEVVVGPVDSSSSSEVSSEAVIPGEISSSSSSNEFGLF